MWLPSSGRITDWRKRQGKSGADTATWRALSRVATRVGTAVETSHERRPTGGRRDCQALQGA